jgi:hypothetical protein
LAGLPQQRRLLLQRRRILTHTDRTVESPAFGGAFAWKENASATTSYAPSVEFKQRIAAKIADEQGRICAKRQRTIPKIAEREGRYQEIDKLEEKILVLIEEVLMELLPEAFAVMKETWDMLTVTAQEHYDVQLIGGSDRRSPAQRQDRRDEHR